ncbi:L,D-transpeptidase-like protein [Breoghania corrubedonensis]|uniref:L,D-transpeptidase-like protein n=1 Tax=Breoghania corrubedonensis TaxID=665038 RepID=A0A2T5VI81_9HYPH|nr:L,D-transpeptidase [Breoghania corrubedonensis]PTW63467.1 L,D-transpeptidase-like protein [Breoghania corrubedonensis]
MFKLKRLLVVAAVVAALFGFASPAGAGPVTNAAVARVTAVISLKDQRMKVTVNGWKRYSWKVSTARRGYRTPTGTFRPTRMYERYYSKKYHHSPMPWSVFFYHGFAIHGTNAIGHLGRPASHGCIRLHPDNARKLFDLVKQYGSANTTIVVTP